MTEAGWTSNAPTKEGWYWWQRTENDNPVVVWVNTFHPDKQLRAEMISGRRELLTHFNGLFKGPITPDSYQQGRVAGLREACIAVSQFSSDGVPINADELRIALVQLLGSLAQQAQEGEGVGDGN